ncbi:MAG: ATP-binding protein [Propionibacteriales bacterium]|nr:ATP-binding protein [Propionibacteriales bacterium]
MSGDLEIHKGDPAPEEDAGSVTDAGLTVVVTAMSLSARARAELGSRLGPGHVVRDIRDAGNTADIVLAPAASPQTLSGLRAMFPGATVLVGELSDEDFGVHHPGPIGRMLEGGADGYFVMPGLEVAAAVTRDVAAGRRPLAITGSMGARPAALPGPTAASTVHLLCGLNGAGKTTHARRLEAELPAVRFTLDE